jgi:hypothetical protein
MHSSPSVFSPADRLHITYTDRPVSGWGGLVAVVRYCDRLGLRALLARALPDGRTSPNQIPVSDIALAFLTSVLTGARRFAHVERLRADEVVRAILGLKRMPSAMTVTRYFGGFVRSQVEHLAAVIGPFTLRRLRPPALGAVLDLDSTVFERYGHQQGSLKGHNPRKHGRPSHHPLLAMLAEAKVVLHAWLRSGNTGSARGVEAFLAEALAALPEGFRLYAVRADSGFFVARFLDELERRALPYAIAVRMNPLVHRTVAGLRTWTPFGPGLEVAETRYQAHGWQRPRRLVVVREVLQERPDARGRRLIDVPGYTFHTLVTSLELPAADVWRFYNGRAESENRLKELKEDFGADGFCLQSFDGTEAAFRLICFLYNLVTDFKRHALQNETPRLTTVRTQLLVRGAILGADGHRRVLRLGLRGRWREHFEALLARIARITASTVAQLANVSTDQADLPCRPWRPRRSYRPSPLAQAFGTLTN